KDSCYLPEFIAYANKHKIAYQLGAVPAEALSPVSALYKDHKSIYIANWQDRHQSNSMDLNGLIDFNGIPKPELSRVQAFLNHQKYTAQNQPVTRLRDADRLKPRSAYYSAAVVQAYSGPLGFEVPSPKDAKIEWYLVERDVEGNAVVIRP